MRFIDREDAGRQLAEALHKYRDSEAVVYALPRGGVPLGFEIAQALNAPLDLVITRKIGHPMNPEYAVCAITEEGEMLCNEAEKVSLNTHWLKEAAKKEQDEVSRRRHAYLSDIKHIPATDKIAIVVDDGIATGLTIRVAVQSIKKENPKKLVVAVPAAPYDAIEALREDADEIIVLEDARDYLGAVGAYYDNFPQVPDGEVIDLLEKAPHSSK